MQPIIDLLRDNMYVTVIALICGSILANSVIRAVTSVLTARSFERSRREIAAYIAEGTMSPDQGERLLRVKPNGPAMDA